MDERKINLSRRLCVYNAQVISILLYNCGTSALASPSACFLKDKYFSQKASNGRISYKMQTCINKPMNFGYWMYQTLTVKTFGHIFRSCETSPASLVLMFATDSKIKGNHRITSLTILNSDLCQCSINVNLNCLHKLREPAADKRKWCRLRYI